jgi:hypothetical protein
VVGLDLRPVGEQGIVRYVNGFEPLAGPPLASVITILFVLLAGVMVWRRNRWPWLAAGAAFMFVSAAVPGPILLVQSIGEVAFAAGLVSTVTHDWSQGTAELAPTRWASDRVK